MAANQLQAKSWVQKTPDICGGEPCIRTTRITVSGLVEWKKLGLSDPEILAAIEGLTQDDLEVAWDYHRRNRDEIEELIRLNNED